MDYRYGSLIGLVILILDIVVIFEILKSSRSMAGKLLWILFVLFFPVFGLIIYAIFGRKN